MASLSGTDREKLSHIAALPYKAQAVWWLNSFFATHSGEAEKLWSYVEKANALDVERKADGCALDELNAHRLLEIFDETLTVREMRTQLRSVGAIDEKDTPKLVPLCHLLLARYKSDWHHFVNAPQGSEDEINAAQAKLNACKAAFEESEARAQEAASALRAAEQAEAAAKAREAEALAAANEAKAREAEALAAENEAKAREADALAAEAPFKAAEEEVKAALAEVERQEAEYRGKIDDARRRSEEGGAVARGKAKNELAQLEAEDPLPLRKAKITLEAANKRAEKARAPFLAASEIAVAARQQASAAAAQASQARAEAERTAQAASQARSAAEQARQRSAQAKQQAEQALAAAEQALLEAEAFLEEVKRTASGGKGALWWMERELHEQRKYLPTSRGGIARA